MSETDGQWEYETLRPPRGPTKKEAIDPKAQLNELGGDGWELVTTVEYVGGGTKYMVFKRPADAGDDTKTGDSDAETGDGDDTATDGDGGDSGTDADSDDETDTDSDGGARADAATGEGDQ